MEGIAASGVGGGIGAINAFLQQNPTVGFLSGMVALAFIIAFLSKIFRLGERSTSIDRANDAHIARLNAEIERLDKRLTQCEALLRDRDSRISELNGTVQFLTQKVEAQTLEYERMKTENDRLRTENGEQRLEIQRLEFASNSAHKQIERLQSKVHTLEEVERARRFGGGMTTSSTAIAGRRKTDVLTPPAAPRADDEDV